MRSVKNGLLWNMIHHLEKSKEAQAMKNRSHVGIDFPRKIHLEISGGADDHQDRQYRRRMQL